MARSRGQRPAGLGDEFHHRRWHTFDVAALEPQKVFLCMTSDLCHGSAWDGESDSVPIPPVRGERGYKRRFLLLSPLPS